MDSRNGPENLNGPEKDEFFQAVCNITPSAVFVYSDTFRYLNPESTRVTGYTLANLQKLHPWDLVHPDMREAAKKRFYDRLEGKPIPDRYTVKIVAKNGATLWITMSTKLIKYQGETCVLATAVDVTDLKMTEEALNKSLQKHKSILTQVVSTLSSVVEIRDPYTAGHQQRVSKLATAIAREMHLPQERVDSIRIAGLLHDIGKVSIPAEILSKPGGLTDSEFTIIKLHPEVSHSILEKTEFLWPIAQIILQHHERINGSGYPQGLKEDKILPESKVLAVADVVEAIATHRPYRDSLGIDAALEEVEKNSGTLYDPLAAKACLGLFRKKGFTFTD